MKKKVNYKLVFTLTFLYFLISDNPLKAQLEYDLKTTYYDEVSAIRASKKYTDYNLKGRVKSVTKISLDKIDTSFYNFNIEGYLISFLNTGSKSNGIPRQSATYTYKDNRLQNIRKETPYFHKISELIYGPMGLLEKEINKWVDNGERFHQVGVFTYSNSFKELTVNYTYNNESDIWDLPLSINYTFKFDSKLMLTGIRRVINGTESNFGSTFSYNYDSISARIIYASLHDDCAGSNSCLILNTHIIYDDQGNRIYESMNDATIRNSTWSHGFEFIAKYNAKNDLVEEYFVRRGYSGSIQRLSSPKPSEPKDYNKLKKVYEYEYDALGNWVKKFRTDKNASVLIEKRVITYYN